MSTRHMMLLYDVISLLTSFSPVLQKNKNNTDHKILSGECDIGRTFFGIGKISTFKRMIQGAGLKDIGHGPLSNCQELLALSFWSNI